MRTGDRLDRKASNVPPTTTAEARCAGDRRKAKTRRDREAHPGFIKRADRLDRRKMVRAVRLAADRPRDRARDRDLPAR